MELAAGIRLEHVVHIGNTFWGLEIANHLVQYHGQAYAIYHVPNSPLSAAITALSSMKSLMQPLAVPTAVWPVVSIGASVVSIGAPTGIMACDQCNSNAEGREGTNIIADLIWAANFQWNLKARKSMHIYTDTIMQCNSNDDVPPTVSSAAIGTGEGAVSSAAIGAAIGAADIFPHKAAHVL